MKTVNYYLKKFRENPDTYVMVNMAKNAIFASKNGFFSSVDRKNVEWKKIKSRIIAKYGLVLTTVQVLNEIVLEMAGL